MVEEGRNWKLSFMQMLIASHDHISFEKTHGLYQNLKCSPRFYRRRCHSLWMFLVCFFFIVFSSCNLGKTITDKYRPQN